jgi:short-subunit dehydrogenase
MLVIVARDAEKLSAVSGEIKSRQGKVATYVCDISDGAACGRLLSQLLADHPRIDVLINNAGRSIRRAIEHSYDRLHDHERLMRVNYHAAVQMTLGVLPSMVKRGSGHVISISSIGVLGNAPRFSAYNASKSALEAFSRCAAAEFKHRGVHFSVVNMPLVRTPMTAPTEVFGQFKLLEPEQAADIVCDAVIRRPERLSTALGTLSQVVELLAPALSRAIMSETFELLPESSAALGERATGASSAPAGTAFASSSSPVARALVELLSGVE